MVVQVMKHLQVQVHIEVFQDKIQYSEQSLLKVVVPEAQEQKTHTQPHQVQVAVQAVVLHQLIMHLLVQAEVLLKIHQVAHKVLDMMAEQVE
jgi:hypothetical protein